MLFSLFIFNAAANADVAVAGNFDRSYFVLGSSSDISGAQGAASTQHIRHFNLAFDSVIGRVQWVGSQIPNPQSTFPIFQVNFHHSVDDPDFNNAGKRPQTPAFASYLVEPDHSFVERGQSNFIAVLNEPLSLARGDYWISISLYAPNINDANYVWYWSKNRGSSASARFNVASQQLTPSSSSSIFILWGDQPNSPFLDSDNDGVNNHLDLCPNTVDVNEVDENGCSDSQKDTDEDGVSDDIDECPDSAVVSVATFKGVNTAGCTMRQVTSSDLKIVSSSVDSPYSRNGVISDISGAAPVKAFEYLWRRSQKVQVNRVVWRGMSMPPEYPNAFPVFAVSFHEAEDDRAFPYNHKPIIEPLASYIIEGEIFTVNQGSDGKQSIFYADLPQVVELDANTDYWLSISLVAPNLNNSGLQWYWGRSNGLLYSARLDLTTGVLSPVSQNVVFRLYGKDLDQ